MRSKLWFKLGAPIIALSMVAACGTGTDKEPVEDEVPVEDEAPLDENNNEAPVEDENLDDENLDDEFNNNPDNEEVPQDDLNGTNKDETDENR